MSESESATRKKRIDTRLNSSLLNWIIIPFKDDLAISKLECHAVEEYEGLEDPNSLPEPQVLSGDAITELNACVDELQEILILIDKEEME